METHRFAKYFTLQEAQAWLPRLKKDMAEIQAIFNEMEAIGFDVYNGRYKPGFHPDTLEAYPHRYRRFLNLVNQILDAGIQIKSIENGLVDFPAVRANGQEVFLCWQLGETDILFWHEIQAGFAGRQPIETF